MVVMVMVLVLVLMVLVLMVLVVLLVLVVLVIMMMLIMVLVVVLMVGEGGEGYREETRRGGTTGVRMRMGRQCMDNLPPLPPRTLPPFPAVLPLCSQCPPAMFHSMRTAT
jgi:hypothetical protein